MAVSARPRHAIILSFENPNLKQSSFRSMDDGEVNAEAGPSSKVLQNTNRQFPPPPAHYKAFTNERWGAFKATQAGDKGKGRAEEETEGDPTQGRNEHAARGGNADLAYFVKPRADWIEEEGGWNSFGQAHYTKSALPTAESWGVPNLRPPDSSMTDKQYMHLLLRSFMQTKLALLETFSKTLRPMWEVRQAGGAYDGYEQARHLEAIITNMMIVANNARGPQAEETLILTMEAQLKRRREQTEALRSKCSELNEKLGRLGEDASAIVQAKERVREKLTGKKLESGQLENEDVSMQG